MLVFRKTSAESPKIAIVIGSGLIGNSIKHHLLWNGFRQAGRFNSDWIHPDSQRSLLASAARSVADLTLGSATEFHFIWSAGKGGFASSEEDLEIENRCFDHMVDFFEQSFPRHSAIFHYLSSAGGLFEGQILVDEHSRPKPIRVYGQMKISQEERLRDAADTSSKQIRIYRPSTVYGARKFSHRSGLVSHLVWNALRNCPTILEANLHALRDFVYVDDVGRFITHIIQQGHGPAQEIYHLVSGKPSSIFEVVQRVQKLIGKSLIYQFSNNCPNDADITFSPHILPPGWNPSDLSYGLHAVVRESAKSYVKRAYA